MTIHFDEKGKFFTNIINKDPIHATIQTVTNRITGAVHIRKGERIKDEFNRADKFFAVTDADIFGNDGTVVSRSNFLLINTNHIVWLIPEEENDSASSGDEM